MNATKIKTRHGLILQDLLGTALSQAGFSFRENWQYDPDLERPDFMIPDSDSPTFAVEVHQTDARNSFQMKTLRSLNAVAEAKVFFGEKLVSVNVLFGDPDNELPVSNVKALCGIFDVNLVPRNDLQDGHHAKSLEEEALKLAKDETHDVASAADKLRSACKTEITGLASIVKRALTGVAADKHLAKIWVLEKKRMSSLLPAPTALPITHYKRCILESLYLSDDDFAELVKVRDPNKGSKSLQKQLVDTGLATTRKSIGGDKLDLIPRMRDFIGDASAPKLRAICSKALNAEVSMHWFFEDIRNNARRTEMAKAFLALSLKGAKAIEDALFESIRDTNFMGIGHERAWVADFLPLTAGASQNEFNRRMVQTGRDPHNYQYPFNHVVGRFERLINSPDHFRDLANYSVSTYGDICADLGVNIGSCGGLSIEDLARALLAARLDGAIKLQRLNPLYEVIMDSARSLGLEAIEVREKSLVYDLSGGDGRLGKNDALVVRSDAGSILLKAIYVGEGYGSDHKADEWSARIRSLGYRIENGVPAVQKRLANVLVVDGEWSEKSLKKLHSAGWTHICQLPDVDRTLRSIFGITKK